MSTCGFALNPGYENTDCAKVKPHIVFLVNQDSLNYEAHKTIPVFAKELRDTKKYKVTVILGNGKNTAFHFPGLEVISGADLLVIFARRVALSHHQMAIVKRYFKEGKPLVAIRTANHAFSVREKLSEGFESWDGFVPEILGCQNRGYGPVNIGIDVAVQGSPHPVLSNLYGLKFHSEGNLYRVAPLLDDLATVLLKGNSGSETEPVAWLRFSGKSRVFYTSLGYPTDFKSSFFKNLLVNGIDWAMEKEKL
ncbi:ThuA domain-containing protein [Dyadobacter frigoris]|nr:ThuA domain-containing protein [Dyadobacter frigoris]GLU53388.1 hypothetical protein Dfri01_28490 [Dyadobacter frigoris]